MNVMTIGSTFITKMLSKLITMMIRKKLGYQVDIQINSLIIDINDDQAQVHLDADAQLAKTELMKIAKTIGMD